MEEEEFAADGVELEDISPAEPSDTCSLNALSNHRRDPVSTLSSAIKLACFRIADFKNIPADITCQQPSDDVHAVMNRWTQESSARDFDEKEAICVNEYLTGAFSAWDS